MIPLVFFLSGLTFAADAPVPASPPAPVVAPPADASEETLFIRFVKAGGPIVWCILIPMSFFTVERTLELLFLTRRRRLLPPGAADEIISLAARLDPTVLISRLVNAKDFVRRAVHRTLVRAKQEGVQPRRLEHVAADALQEQALTLMRKAELCNIFGNVAPMVGLFGTVVGIIKALHELGVSRGQPRPDQLAEHISVALVATFWGLLVAIPSLAVHGFIRTRIESLVGQAAESVETVLRAIRLPIPDAAKRSSDPTTVAKTTSPQKSS
ncbi:MAG: MotA/TolQ/ExbB proton channel family protein [Phycisphaerae bacterium]|nr:MotA/TolQ/ExbB proton channel family protein [Phycisphaerae bacterium]